MAQDHKYKKSSALKRLRNEAIKRLRKLDRTKQLEIIAK